MAVEFAEASPSLTLRRYKTKLFIKTSKFEAAERQRHFWKNEATRNQNHVKTLQAQLAKLEQEKLELLKNIDKLNSIRNLNRYNWLEYLNEPKSEQAWQSELLKTHLELANERKINGELANKVKHLEGLREEWKNERKNVIEWQGIVEVLSKSLKETDERNQRENEEIEKKDGIWKEIKRKLNKQLEEKEMEVKVALNNGKLKNAEIEELKAKIKELTEEKCRKRRGSQDAGSKEKCLKKIRENIYDIVYHPSWFEPLKYPGMEAGSRFVNKDPESTVEN